MHTHACTHNPRKCVRVPPVPPPVLLDTTMLRWVCCNKVQMGSHSLSFTHPPPPHPPPPIPLSHYAPPCLGGPFSLAVHMHQIWRACSLFARNRTSGDHFSVSSSSQESPRVLTECVGGIRVRDKEKEREAQSCQRKRSSVHKHKGTGRMKRRRGTEGSVGRDVRYQSWEFESMMLKNEGRRILHKSSAESRRCCPKEGLIMKLQRAAVRPFLQGATPAVNTHFIESVSRHAGPSHSGVLPATR